VDDTSGQQQLVELGVGVLVRIVRPLRLLFGIEVVEVAAELIETGTVGKSWLRSPRWFLPKCPVA
jgi:hypothetical protein